MSIRTSETTVTFDHPFRMADADELLPAGTYRVIVDEEELPTATFVAYRRVATTLMTPRIEAPQHRRVALLVSQSELEAALMKDRQQTV
jgi:hypothetical protein